MNELTDDLYKKIVYLSQTVKSTLTKKGFAIPIENDDGSITVGHYTIKKQDIFYYIFDYSDQPVVEKINLPQTALLLANKLALGKFIDKEILSFDRLYGYAMFEEQLETQLLKRSKKDLFDLRSTKASIARKKKELYKHSINISFEKLKQII